MTPMPKKNKDWIKEVKAALGMAWTIIAEAEAEDAESYKERLYIAAPAIAMQQRGLDYKKDEQAAIFAIDGILILHGEYPEYKEKYNRSFVYAYFDTLVHLKLAKKSKCLEITNLLLEKGVIEP